jgi:dihydroxyacetone kinase-like predicted kinase
MAANAAASVADKPVAVVPTNSVPAAFSAMIAADTSLSLDQLAQVMTEAASGVRTAEVTVAVKDATGKVGAIKAGQVIGIVDDKEIEVAGDSIDDVAFEIAQVIAEDAETLAIFAGADYTDESLAALAARIAEKLDDVEIETHRGEQPLYPVVMAAE